MGTDRQGRGPAQRSRTLRRVLVLAAAIAAACILLVGATLPAARLVLATPWPDGTVGGIVHVHTNRSDGRGTPEEVAAAASRTGLRFVVFTDHGDATRTPDRPVYRSGVLCLDAVEISTTGGHYIAVDMPAAPYPLAGEARDVVEDVKRLGGFGIVAHPDSPKTELRWREWTAPFDAIELLNPDTSWREWMNDPGTRPKLRLIRGLIDYPFRPAEAIAALLRPSKAIYQWSALAMRRRLVALAGADAHANLALRNNDPGDAGFALALPGYEASFGVLSLRVAIDRPFTGNAAADAAVIMRALRAGHVHTAIDAFASPAAFEFSATNALGTVHEGDELGLGGPVTLRVRSNAPAAFTTTLFEGMKAVASGAGETLTFVGPPSPTVYRVEIRDPRRPVPWIASNAIYVRQAEPLVRPITRPPITSREPLFDGTPTGWQVETDPQSKGALEAVSGPRGAELQFAYTLAASGGFAGMSYTIPNGAERSDRLAFTARADRPMRISVQLRNWRKPEVERWRRSVYIDTYDQDHVVYFDELTPVGVTQTWRPVLPEVRSVLFVVDTTNTKPASSGRVTIGSVALAK